MFRIGVVIVLLAMISACVAQPAQPAVELIPQPPLAPEVEAFPRVAGEQASPAAKRINAALAILDETFRSWAESCEQASRSTSIALRGARYLALVSDSWFYCGGAHPQSGTDALTYDLWTGAPVEWERLFPPSLGVKRGYPSLPRSDTTSRLVSSTALSTIYSEDVLKRPDYNPFCAKVLSAEETVFQLWPVAKDDGLAMLPVSFAYMQTLECAAVAVIPVEHLRDLGMDRDLLADIEAAHAAIER